MKIIHIAHLIQQVSKSTFRSKDTVLVNLPNKNLQIGSVEVYDRIK